MMRRCLWGWKGGEYSSFFLFVYSGRMMLTSCRLVLVAVYSLMVGHPGWVFERSVGDVKLGLIGRSDGGDVEGERKGQGV
jgi:hypothetical protein